MTRKCSHCSHNGHNSRTCPNKGVKLFGVRLDGSIRKSASMGNLTLYSGSNNGSNQNLSNLHDSPGDTPDHGPGTDGYASEDFVKGSSSSCRERKKGVPWTEEEHRLFLLGLQKLGKGDWRGISRNYVMTRTPTQVASHAQKYFIRQCNMSRRKRRSSLFDMITDEPADAPQVGSDVPMSHRQAETQNNHPLPFSSLDEECESMGSTNNNQEEPPVLQNPVAMPIIQSSYPVIFPAYYTPYFPFPVPVWPGYTAEQTTTKESHEIVKPTAVHIKSPMNVEHLGGMSKLTLGESLDQMGQSPSTSLSLQMPGGSSTRQSAFHANNPVTVSSTVKSSSSPIHAV